MRPWGIALVLPFLFVPSPRATSPPIVVIWMENKERSTIEKSADADYLKTFENAGISFTHYTGVAHPSLPNYLAFASGSTKGKIGTDTVRAGELRGKTIWTQLSTTGQTWKVYMESMPSVCYAGSSSGGYVLKHNPATPFAKVFNTALCNNVVPYSALDRNNLPAVSFIAPNLCNDMHDCSIATGDNWLQANVPPLLNAGAEVVITFDEGSSGQGGGGNVYMAADGPGISSSVNAGTFNHYGLLAALELRQGLPRLGKAQGAAVLPI